MNSSPKPQTRVSFELPVVAAEKMASVQSDAMRGDPAAKAFLAEAAAAGFPLVSVEIRSACEPAGEQLPLLPVQGANRPAGWQLHPSTRTAHYFRADEVRSLCRREQRTTGEVVAEPGVFPCTRCQRAMGAGK